MHLFYVLERFCVVFGSVLEKKMYLCSENKKTTTIPVHVSFIIFFILLLFIPVLFLSR